MPSECRPNRGLRIAATIGIFSFALLVLFRNQILTTTADLITTESSSDIDDNSLAILLMGDNTGDRAQAAVDFAVLHPLISIVIAPEEPTTFVSRGYIPPGHLAHKKYLLDAGVSEAKIIEPDCLNTSTFDEAVCMRRYINDEFPEADSIIIVTSWYHSSRAKWIFEKVFSDTRIKVKSYTAQSERSSPVKWWQREQNFLHVFNEYLKWAYWLARSGSIKYPEP